MNKELYKAVNKSKEFDKIKKIVIYTNAKIIPKGENLNCLKHEKVIIDITNYGGELANKHESILKVLEGLFLLVIFQILKVMRELFLCVIFLFYCSSLG